jgi:hypothetical protein
MAGWSALKAFASPIYNRDVLGGLFSPRISLSTDPRYYLRSERAAAALPDHPISWNDWMDQQAQFGVTAKEMSRLQMRPHEDAYMFNRVTPDKLDYWDTDYDAPVIDPKLLGEELLRKRAKYVQQFPKGRARKVPPTVYEDPDLEQLYIDSNLGYPVRDWEDQAVKDMLWMNATQHGPEGSLLYHAAPYEGLATSFNRIDTALGPAASGHRLAPARSSFDLTHEPVVETPKADQSFDWARHVTPSEKIRKKIREEGMPFMGAGAVPAMEEDPFAVSMPEGYTPPSLSDMGKGLLDVARGFAAAPIEGMVAMPLLGDIATQKLMNPNFNPSWGELLDEETYADYEPMPMTQDVMNAMDWMQNFADWLKGDSEVARVASELSPF